MGFYKTSQIISDSSPIQYSIPRCGACGLYKRCNSPKMPVTGQGKKEILIVGEAPGETEDDLNEQFVGATGRLLRDQLDEMGVDLDRDCWKTNALICKPDFKIPSNLESVKEIAYCRPNLINSIKELKPKLIILLGRVAINSLIGSIWDKQTGTMERWAGWQIPCQRYDCFICPIHHPSFVLRDKTGVAQVLFKRHLQNAISLLRKDRPWSNGPPNYNQRVRSIFDADEAVTELEWMLDQGGTITFDLETSALKPDNNKERIVTCGVCWEGKKTIAYPWQKKTRIATGRLLKSKKVKKIGWNCKFEDRWIIKEFGWPVENWIWDGMQNAHIINNTKGVTSLDFQSFVLLGNEIYSKRVSKFFKDGGAANKEIALGDLLHYNGMDTLIEYETSMKQMEILK